MRVIPKILAVIFMLSQGLVYAQEIDLRLAEEYFNEGEYEKANSYYEELFDQENLREKIYENYLTSLFYSQDYKQAAKINKLITKDFPDMYAYKVDQGVIELKSGDKEKADKLFYKLIEETPSNVNYYNQISNRFIKYEMLDWAEKTLEIGAIKGDKRQFAYSLSSIYIRMNEKEKLQNHLINGVVDGSIARSYAQNALQRVLVKEDYDDLEKKVIELIQKDPGNYDLSELMIWIYYQKKDFYGALMQAKAFDRRNDMGGEKVMEVGKISMKNEDYENAIEAFQYITEKYPESQYNLPAKKHIIYAKEEIVKNKFPIDTAQVKSLIDDYHYILDLFGSSPANADLYRRIANLHAFYLGAQDHAVEILEKLIQIRGASPKLVSYAKLDLGDIYILKEMPWEASLLYSQVEKDNKDTPLGFEAKLRNARLSYYKGEFELAKAHLDILKLATSREIANDAMDLSLLIQDNTGLDTSYDAMNAFANAELLVFQHKMDEAISTLKQMLVKFAGHPLTDEIYFQIANIYIRIGEFEKAVQPLQKIDELYSDDILADDALMTLAKLYEEHLNNKDLAMTLYESIIVDYSGSIYTEEARKRFRTLRGDFQNSENSITP